MKRWLTTFLLITIVLILSGRMVIAGELLDELLVPPPLPSPQAPEVTPSPMLVPPPVPEVEPESTPLPFDEPPPVPDDEAQQAPVNI